MINLNDWSSASPTDISFTVFELMKIVKINETRSRYVAVDFPVPHECSISSSSLRSLFIVASSTRLLRSSCVSPSNDVDEVPDPPRVYDLASASNSDDGSYTSCPNPPER